MKKKLQEPIEPDLLKGFLTYMDYAATCEGRTFELNFCLADTEAEAKQKHLDKFYPNDTRSQEYFGIGVVVMPIESKRAKELLSKMFRFGKGLHKDLCEAGIEFHLKYYVNHS